MIGIVAKLFGNLIDDKDILESIEMDNMPKDSIAAPIMESIENLVGKTYPSMLDTFKVASADGLDISEAQAFVEVIGQNNPQNLSAEEIDRSLLALNKIGLEPSGDAIAGMHDVLEKLKSANGLGIGLETAPNVDTSQTLDNMIPRAGG